MASRFICLFLLTISGKTGAPGENLTEDGALLMVMDGVPLQVMFSGPFFGGVLKFHWKTGEPGENLI